MDPDDDLPPPDAAAALQLIRDQRGATARQLQPDARLLYWPWGVAWLVGFGLFFLRFSPDGRGLLRLPDWLPLTALFVLLVAAAAIQAVTGKRAYGQVTGDSSRRGRWYGCAWVLGSLSVFAVLGRVVDHLPYDQAALLWSATAVGLTGALQMAGGAIWLDRDLFRLGVWISVTNVIGTFAGPGWHALVLAVAGSGGILAAGAISWRRQRHPQ
ncbi:transporter [Micromonospora acroterricola]|uniref:Transporter n=1 Tax=Micromonospora acroterricola TaxID=2202421 RepID=A0A317D8R4_9ACTN|nr:transporter [Micromonospora acroterricola]PWR10994.1 transporter [Micromonospora acroterricola]